MKKRSAKTVKESEEKKPILKYAKVVRFVVDYNVLSEFISEVYGHNYDCQQDMEWGNDSHNVISVCKELAKIYQNDKQVEDFKLTGEGAYILHPLMYDLAVRELIPYGTYDVRVCW